MASDIGTAIADKTTNEIAPPCKRMMPRLRSVPPRANDASKHLGDYGRERGPIGPKRRGTDEVIRRRTHREGSVVEHSQIFPNGSACGFRRKAPLALNPFVRLASALIRLASTAKPSPPTRPLADAAVEDPLTVNYRKHIAYFAAKD
jgi:hypothetical protein